MKLSRYFLQAGIITPPAAKGKKNHEKALSSAGQADFYCKTVGQNS
jgi:hypothetical protein